MFTVRFGNTGSQLLTELHDYPIRQGDTVPPEVIEALSERLTSQTHPEALADAILSPERAWNLAIDVVASITAVCIWPDKLRAQVAKHFLNQEGTNEKILAFKLLLTFVNPNAAENRELYENAIKVAQANLELEPFVEKLQKRLARKLEA